MALFEFLDELMRFLFGTAQDEMDMVGHQNEREHAHVQRDREHRDQVHPHLEVFIIPEPDLFRQMIGSDKPEFHTNLQNTNLTNNKESVDAGPSTGTKIVFLSGNRMLFLRKKRRGECGVLMVVHWVGHHERNRG